MSKSHCGTDLAIDTSSLQTGEVTGKSEDRLNTIGYIKLERPDEVFDGLSWGHLECDDDDNAETTVKSECNLEVSNTGTKLEGTGDIKLECDVETFDDMTRHRRDSSLHTNDRVHHEQIESRSLSSSRSTSDQSCGENAENVRIFQLDDLNRQDKDDLKYLLKTKQFRMFKIGWNGIESDLVCPSNGDSFSGLKDAKTGCPLCIFKNGNIKCHLGRKHQIFFPGMLVYHCTICNLYEVGKESRFCSHVATNLVALVDRKQTRLNQMCEPAQTTTKPTETQNSLLEINKYNETDMVRHHSTVRFVKKLVERKYRLLEIGEDGVETDNKYSVGHSFKNPTKSTHSCPVCKKKMIKVKRHMIFVHKLFFPGCIVCRCKPCNFFHIGSVDRFRMHRKSKRHVAAIKALQTRPAKKFKIDCENSGVLSEDEYEKDSQHRIGKDTVNLGNSTSIPDGADVKVESAANSVKSFLVEKNQYKLTELDSKGLETTAFCPCLDYNHTKKGSSCKMCHKKFKNIMLHMALIHRVCLPGVAVFHCLPCNAFFARQNRYDEHKLKPQHLSVMKSIEASSINETKSDILNDMLGEVIAERCGSSRKADDERCGNSCEANDEQCGNSQEAGDKRCENFRGANGKHFVKSHEETSKRLTTIQMMAARKYKMIKIGSDGLETTVYLPSNDTYGKLNGLTSCPFCPKSMKNLKRHMTVAHKIFFPGSVVYKCELCDIINFCKIEFDRHEKTVSHQNALKKLQTVPLHEPKKRKIKKYGAENSTKSDLRRVRQYILTEIGLDGLETVTLHPCNNKKLKLTDNVCPLCLKSFQKVKTHVANMHQIYFPGMHVFSCVPCNVVFACRNNFKRHKHCLQHETFLSSNRSAQVDDTTASCVTFNCSLCGVSCASEVDLDEHKQTQQHIDATTESLQRPMLDEMETSSPTLIGNPRQSGMDEIETRVEDSQMLDSSQLLENMQYRIINFESDGKERISVHRTNATEDFLSNLTRSSTNVCPVCKLKFKKTRLHIARTHKLYLPGMTLFHCRPCNIFDLGGRSRFIRHKASQSHHLHMEMASTSKSRLSGASKCQENVNINSGIVNNLQNCDEIKKETVKIEVDYQLDNEDGFHIKQEADVSSPEDQSPSSCLQENLSLLDIPVGSKSIDEYELQKSKKSEIGKRKSRRLYVALYKNHFLFRRKKNRAKIQKIQKSSESFTQEIIEKERCSPEQEQTVQVKRFLPPLVKEARSVKWFFSKASFVNDDFNANTFRANCSKECCQMINMSRHHCSENCLEIHSNSAFDGESAGSCCTSGELKPQETENVDASCLSKEMNSLDVECMPELQPIAVENGNLSITSHVMEFVAVENIDSLCMPQLQPIAFEKTNVRSDREESQLVDDDGCVPEHLEQNGVDNTDVNCMPEQLEQIRDEITDVNCMPEQLEQAVVENTDVNCMPEQLEQIGIEIADVDFMPVQMEQERIIENTDVNCMPEQLEQIGDEIADVNCMPEQLEQAVVENTSVNCMPEQLEQIRDEIADVDCMPEELDHVEVENTDVNCMPEELDHVEVENTDVNCMPEELEQAGVNNTDAYCMLEPLQRAGVECMADDDMSMELEQVGVEGTMEQLE